MAVVGRNTLRTEAEESLLHVVHYGLRQPTVFLTPQKSLWILWCEIGAFHTCITGGKIPYENSKTIAIVQWPVSLVLSQADQIMLQNIQRRMSFVIKALA